MIDVGRTDRWIGWLVAIGIAALALRLAHLAWLRHTPVFAVLIGDALQYDAWARQIAGGQWIGTEVFYQTPLYPYLLAIVFKLAGHHLLLVRAIQAALGAMSCVWLCVAGRRFFGDRAGLAAGALLAIYPPAIFFDGLIQKSSLDLFLMTLLLALLGEFLARPHWKWLIAAGLAMGAFALNRENARVLYPIIAVWLLVYFRATPLKTRAAWAGVFTVAIAALLVPVGLRNYHVSGDFLTSTSQLGPNFYIGNHAGAHGGYEALVADHGNAAFERDDATRLAEDASGRRLSPAEVSDYWLGRALRDIRSEPSAWLALAGRKLLLTLNVVEAVDTESIEVYSDYSPVLHGLLWFNFGIIFPLAVLGAWQTRDQWRRLAVLYATLVGLTLSVAIFYVLARYRHPIVPVVLLFAGAAVSAIPSAAAGGWRRWIPGLLLALVAACVVNVPMKTSYDETRLNLGTELIRTGQPADAVPLLERAAAEAPDYGPPHFDLGVALDRTGQTARAIEEFAVAVRLQPDSLNVHETLAVALWHADRREEAIAHYQEAVRLKPDDPVGQNNLANALLQQQRIQEAMPHFEAALKLKPDFAEAHSNLALAYQMSADFDNAVEHFREAARLAPESYGIRVNFGNLLLRLGRTKEAIDEYQRALAIVPDSVDDQANLLSHLAEAYARDGRLKDGADTLEKALALAQAAGRNDVVQQLAPVIREWRARLAAAPR
jgi:Flp pilus assembly protein TadD/4-amino-4-deoxy-L-arabinose transferase-like glycosyltransferase